MYGVGRINIIRNWYDFSKQRHVTSIRMKCCVSSTIAYVKLAEFYKAISFLDFA